jgi:hypothetical protein
MRCLCVERSCNLSPSWRAGRGGRPVSRLPPLCVLAERGFSWSEYQDLQPGRAGREHASGCLLVSGSCRETHTCGAAWLCDQCAKLAAVLSLLATPSPVTMARGGFQRTNDTHSPGRFSCDDGDLVRLKIKTTRQISCCFRRRPPPKNIIILKLLCVLPINITLLNCPPLTAIDAIPAGRPHTQAHQVKLTTALPSGPCS